MSQFANASVAVGKITTIIFVTAALAASAQEAATPGESKAGLPTPNRTIVVPAPEAAPDPTTTSPALETSPLPEGPAVNPRGDGLIDASPVPAVPYQRDPVRGAALDEVFRLALSYEPGISGRTGVTLLDAVRATLLQSPQVRLSVNDAVIAKAAVKIVTGEFDATIFADYSIGREWKPFTPAEIRNSVLKRQLLYSSLRSILSERRQLEGENRSLQSGAAVDNTPTGQLEAFTRNLALRNATPDEQEDAVQLLKKINDEFIDSFKKEEASFKKGIKDSPVHSVQRLENITYQGGVRKQLRNGVEVELSANYEHVRDAKVPDTVNKSQVGLTINVPLGRGSGVESVGAPERAALIDYGASLLNLRQATAVTVYETVLAYWDCVAAEERLALLTRSEQLSRSLVGLARDLLDHHRIMASEIPLAEAKLESSQGDRLAAELALLAANQKLALAMGIPAERISMFPIAADPFPNPESATQVEALPLPHLIGAALERRGDYRATLQLEKSGKVLAEAARLDLRPRIDLGFRVAYQGVEEGSDFENNVNAFVQDPRGPSFSVKGAIEWPVANNTQEGLFVQAHARYLQAQIRSGDLSRRIVANVVFTQKSLLNSLRQLDTYGTADQRYKEALADARNRFSDARGRGSLYEVIDTEERLTRARIEFVNARLLYAQTVARLRLETSTLVPDGVIIENKDPVARVEALNATDLISLPKSISFPLTGKATTARGGKIAPLSAGDSVGPGPKVKIYSREPEVPFISGHPAWHR